MALPLTVRRAFEKALDPHDVLTDPVQCRAYECDGLTGYRVVPELVLLPRDAAQVAAAVRVCAEHRVPFVARGAGTGLSGGALPVADGVVISLARLKRILEVDPVDRRAVVEPGVTTSGSPPRPRPHGLLLRPRPVAASRSARSAATSPRTPAARTASSTASRPTTCSASRWCCPTGRSSPSAATTGEQAGPTCAGCSSAPRARWASPRRSPCGCCAPPRRSARCWPTSRRSARRATSSATSSAPGIVPAAVEMMDTPRDRGRRGGRSRRLPVGVPGGADHRGGRARAPSATPQFAQVKAICDRARLHARCTSPAPPRSGRRSGRAARRRSPPSAGSRPTTSCRTAWCPAPGCRDPGPDRGHGRRGRAADRQRLPRRRRQHPPAGALQRRAGRDRAGRAPVGGDRRAVRGAGRVAVRRARHRHGQGVLDAEDVRRGRPRDDGTGCARRSTRTGCATRARCCPRRGCAASAPAATARTRWRRRG